MKLEFPVMITLNKIREYSPCIDGWEKVLKAHGGINADLDKPLPLSSIIDTNELGDCLWALRCKPEYSSLYRKLAVVFVDEVSHLMRDQRSKTALDVAWRHSEGLATDEELKAAYRDAARAARAARASAYALAAYASYYAAYAADANDEVESYQIEVLRKALTTGVVERKPKQCFTGEPN